MSIKDILTADFKVAMKEKDKVKKDTISFVRAAIKQVEVDEKRELSDDDVISIISKQIKMRKDGIAAFKDGGRSDLVKSYEDEIEVLTRYMPKQLSDDEILDIVKKTIDDNSIEKDPKNMGKIMGMVIKKVKGLADGNRVRQIVQDYIS